MSFPRVVGIAGNLKRPSRTRALVEAVAAALAHRREIDLAVYDLLDAGPGLGAAYARDDLTPEAARVVEAIETADALVDGSPVYKGSMRPELPDTHHTWGLAAEGPRRKECFTERRP